MNAIGGALWTWFAQTAVPFFWQAFSSLSKSILNTLGNFFPVIKVAIFLFPLMEMFLLGLEKLVVKMQQINFAALSAPDSSLLAYGAFFNRFMPLSEFFVIQLIMIGVWIAVLVVRWIKSFIPTVAN